MVSVDVLFVSLFQWESLHYITLHYCNNMFLFLLLLSLVHFQTFREVFNLQLEGSVCSSV